ncbi:Uncharacterised protein at_DN1935 [Pycnogonum litorale]
MKRVSAMSSSSTESHTPPSSQTQWYDNRPDGPIIELNEQLTTHRPPRSEADKRLSRLSGQFTPPKMMPTRHNSLANVMLSSSPKLSTTPVQSISCGNLVNNETVDGSAEIPPPLPQKQCYADYSNLAGDDVTKRITSLPRKNSIPIFPPRIQCKPPPPLPVKEQTPPKKPPHRAKTSSSIDPDVAN